MKELKGLQISKDIASIYQKEVDMKERKIIDLHIAGKSQVLDRLMTTVILAGETKLGKDKFIEKVGEYEIHYPLKYEGLGFKEVLEQ